MGIGFCFFFLADTTKISVVKKYASQQQQPRQKNPKLFIISWSQYCLICEIPLFCTSQYRKPIAPRQLRGKTNYFSDNMKLEIKFSSQQEECVSSSANATLACQKDYHLFCKN